MSYRNYSITNGFIVDSKGTGDFQTINDAYIAAKSGTVIGVMPGTYSGAYTVKPGTTLCAMPGSTGNKAVILSGQGVYAGGANVSFSNITFQSNSAYAFIFNGSTNGSILFDDCYLDAVGFTSLSHVSTASDAEFKLRRCSGDLSANVAFFDVACVDNMRLQWCEFQNSFGSTLANTVSAGTLFVDFTILRNPINISGTTGAIVHETITINTSGENVPCLNITSTKSSGNGSNGRYSELASGSASAITLGPGSLYTTKILTLDSNAAFAISGNGTLQYGIIGNIQNLAFDPALTIVKLPTFIGNLTLATPLAVNSGGTGLNAVVTGDLIYAPSANLFSRLPIGATGDILTISSGVPKWSTSTFPINVGATGTILRSDGTNWVASTATYPNTTTINQLLYSSSANTITGLATANSSILVTDSGGVPSLSTTLPFTLPVTSGGTGLQTLTAHSLQVGAGTSSPTQLAVGATGTVLTGVTGADPAFSATPSVTSITLGGGTALGAYVEGTWTPTLIGGSTAGTTTYSLQFGYYVKIGSLVWYNFIVSGTAATGTGNAIIQTLPFISKNQSGGNYIGSIINQSSATWVYPVGATDIALRAAGGQATIGIFSSGSASTGSFIQMANAAFSFTGTIVVQV